jgi:hypothetical protein
MTASADDILDDLFHGCALTAFLEEAQARQDWPDSEATRLRAYRYYEDALAEKNRLRAPEYPTLIIPAKCTLIGS